MSADLITAAQSVSTQGTESASIPSTKSPAAFRTITEVANELELPQHVLRFWESRFSQIRPMKRRGGRRYYRPEDVVMLREIRRLLHVEGYTIRGVQKLLREQNRKALLARRPAAEAPPASGGDAANDAAAPPASGDSATNDAAEPKSSPVSERPLSTAQRKELLALLADLEELRALFPDKGPARGV